MTDKSLNWKEADAQEQKLDKELAALTERQTAERQRIKDARRASAGEALNEALETLSNVAEYLTEAQKAQVSNFFGPAKKIKGTSKPRNTAPKEPRAHNRFLHDGKKTPFAYGGKGRKPDILREFEASDAGVKLKKEGKPTYGDL